MQDYKIIEKISQSQNKIIHLVQKNNKFFILKELFYSQMDQKEKKQLIAQVNILKEFKHQNIVRCIERYLDKDKQKINIIMEYCLNGDLQNIINQHKYQQLNIPEEKIWKFITQIGLAIQELHKRKDGTILHRDIRPSNIFIDQDQNYKLGDFGVVKILQNEQFLQTGIQNVHYQSPEQLQESLFSEKSDIWAFACCIYEMVNQEPPIQGDNQIKLALNINKKNKFKMNKNYSKQLQNIIFYGLEIDYKKRPSIDDILGMQEIQFHIREQRLIQQQEKNKKLINDIEIKKNSLKKREDDQIKRQQDYEQRQQELILQKQQLQKIYDESLQDLKQKQIQIQQQHNLYRNNSQEIQNNSFQQLKQDYFKQYYNSPLNEQKTVLNNIINLTRVNQPKNYFQDKMHSPPHEKQKTNQFLHAKNKYLQRVQSQNLKNKL